jgi:hypothetical protein
MTRRSVAGCTLALALVGLTSTQVLADLEPLAISPNSQPHPPSDGSAALTDGNLVAGAGGTYTPIPPSTIKPGGNDPGAPTTAPPPYPAPNCPGGFSYLQWSPGVYFYTIWPSFTRSQDGGYDGHDAWYGYDVPDAIQPGGNPAWTDDGYPATAANMAGHKIAVRMEIASTSAWSAFSLKWSSERNGILGPSAPATCDSGAITYGFGQAFLDGAAPASVPPPSVVNVPPFGVGPTLLANVSGKWRIGTVSTLPGPGSTTRTFVHIPTCAWLDSGVPTAPTALHSVTSTTVSNGYTVFLVYNITVTPGDVTWDWGDGTQNGSQVAPESAPVTLPRYDAAAQTWSDSCSVSHEYSTVSDGRTITATQTFTIAITVLWNDGITTWSQTVACDAATGGACVLTIGAAQGWQSGPHPVDQIEPIPFSPQLGG